MKLEYGKTYWHTGQEKVCTILAPIPKEHPRGEDGDWWIDIDGSYWWTKEDLIEEYTEQDKTYELYIAEWGLYGSNYRVPLAECKKIKEWLESLEEKAALIFK